MGAVFAQGAYRRLWAARTASQWGDVFATVALALLVFELTGSPLGVSTVVLVEIIPVLALAPFAGTLVDRLPRVRVMVLADLWRAALAGLLVLFADNVVAVYLIAFGLAFGVVFFNPAANSLLPALVGNRELVAANSGIWTAAVLSQIALAPLAGIAYGVGGPEPAFAINAGSFLISAMVLAGLRVPSVVSSIERRGFFTDVISCLRLVVSDRLLLALSVGQLLAALSAGATSALLVVLARQQLDLDARGYGLLVGAIGIGAVLGPFLLTRLVHQPLRPRFVFGPFALRGVVDMVLAASGSLPVALVALVAYGLGTSSGAVTFNSLLQHRAPEHARGRIFALFDMTWQLGRLTSLLLGGVLAATVGIGAVYYVGGALLLAAAAIGWAGARAASAPAG